MAVSLSTFGDVQSAGGSYIRSSRAVVNEEQVAVGQIKEGRTVTTQPSGVVALPNVARHFVGSSTREEYEALNAEHGRLVQKSFREGLSRKEGLELQMIRWAIDRAESEMLSPSLNALDRFVELHQALESEVERLLAVSKK